MSKTQAAAAGKSPGDLFADARARGKAQGRAQAAAAADDSAAAAPPPAPDPTPAPTPAPATSDPSPGRGLHLPDSGPLNAGGGLLLGALAYVVAVVYFRSGWPGVRSWFAAKFLNRTANVVPDGKAGAGATINPDGTMTTPGGLTLVPDATGKRLAIGGQF